MQYFLPLEGTVCSVAESGKSWTNKDLRKAGQATELTYKKIEELQTYLKILHLDGLSTSTHF